MKQVKKTNSSIVLGEIIFPYQVIQKAIQAYAKQLKKKYRQEKLVIITIMNGGLFFAIYLVKYLAKLDLEMDFIAVSSYSDNQQKKTAQFYKKLKINITGKHVLILEDIIDTGKTINLVYDFLSALKPKTLEIASLVFREKTPQEMKKTFSFPIFPLLILKFDYWIVGFGIDYGEKFRQLPDIHYLVCQENKQPILTK